MYEYGQAQARASSRKSRPRRRDGNLFFYLRFINHTLHVRVNNQTIKSKKKSKIIGYCIYLVTFLAL